MRNVFYKAVRVSRNAPKEANDILKQIYHPTFLTSVGIKEQIVPSMISNCQKYVCDDDILAILIKYIESNDYDCESVIDVLAVIGYDHAPIEYEQSLLRCQELYPSNQRVILTMADYLYHKDRLVEANNWLVKHEDILSGMRFVRLKKRLSKALNEN